MQSLENCEVNGFWLWISECNCGEANLVSNCATHVMNATHVSSQFLVYNRDRDMYCVTKAPFEHDISKRDK
jgi:hypothetical protein